MLSVPDVRCRRFTKDHIRFPSVHVDQCESSRDSGISASVIRYAPGHPPQFFREGYEAACAEHGTKAPMSDLLYHASFRETFSILSFERRA
jgi:hypothetical protein